MRSYEETIRNVHRKISLYEAEQKQKRAKSRQIAAAVMPVFAMAAAGTALWRSGACRPAEIRQVSEIPVIPADGTEPQYAAAAQTTRAAPAAGSTEAAAQTAAPVRQNLTGTESEASAAETVPPEQTPAPETAAQNPAAAEQQTVTAAQSTPAVTAGTEAACTTAAPTGNCFMLRGDEQPPEFRTWITSYPVSCSADYRAPYDGEVCYTMPLFYAMQDYGTDAEYYVIIDLYSGVGTADSSMLRTLADLQAEWERLGALGYEAGLNQPSDAAPFLTLHATYEELQSFPAAADRGYFLRLYQEDQQECLPAVFNGFSGQGFCE